jgi:hypothetical protein
MSILALHARFVSWFFPHGCADRFYLIARPTLYVAAAPTNTTAATSIAAARGVLASLERKYDEASGDTSEVQRARSDPRTVSSENEKQIPHTVEIRPVRDDRLR